MEALGLAGGLEDSQASECECEDTGRVGGAGRLEVLAELEARRLSLAGTVASRREKGASMLPRPP